MNVACQRRKVDLDATIRCTQKVKNLSVSCLFQFVVFCVVLYRFVSVECALLIHYSLFIAH